MYGIFLWGKVCKEETKIKITIVYVNMCRKNTKTWAERKR